MSGDLVDDLGSPMSALATAYTTTLHRIKHAFEHQRSFPPSLSSHPAFSAHEFMRLADDIQRSLYQFDSTSCMRSLGFIEGARLLNDLMLIWMFYEDNVGGAVLERMFEEGGDKTLHLHNPRVRARTDPRCPSHGTGIRARAEGERKKYGAEAALGPVRRVVEGRPIFLITGTTTSRTSFPKVKPHAPNTVQNPARSTLTFRSRLKQRLWALGADKGAGHEVCGEDGARDCDACGTGVLGGHKGGVFGFFVVISPVLSQKNMLSLHRVLRTILGALTAAITFKLFFENPAMLAVCRYNVRFKDNTSVELIGFRHATAVIVGVIWAFMLYNRLVANYSCPPESLLRIPQADSRFTTPKKIAPNTPAGGRSPERTPLINGQATRSTPGILNNSLSMNGSNDILIRARTGLPPKASDQLLASIPDFMAMELRLQRQLIRLEELLAQTQHEPRLKGPFPVKLYRSILISLQIILDKLHSMRCVTTREECNAVSDVAYLCFGIYVARQDRMMQLAFVSFGPCIVLVPLPPYLPPVEKSRRELIDVIWKLDTAKVRSVKVSQQLLYFAYALMMKGVIQELDFLGKTLQEAFGVLGGGSTEEFENLFRVEAIMGEEVGGS
ncbi:hypothetical protein M422DRAFT_246378 [Sphaerobolus stellatus SS14]|nr:hypothetical protein M422DRAFT_246378 [Sphaerobolus stellatus SS14]